MARSLRRHIETIVVGAVALSLGVLAFTHQGVPAAELDLNDGGIWVTNQNKLLIGHLNYQSQTLDGGVRAADSGFDVSQAGSHVLVTSPDMVQPLDTATVSFLGEATISGLAVEHGADQVLVADASDGKVWAATTDTAAGFSPSAEPALEDLDQPRIAVATDGTGYVLAADGSLRSVEGSGEDAVITDLGDVTESQPSQDAQLTVVGDTLVVLDGNRLSFGGQSMEDALFEGGALQQASSGSGEVVVATSTALLRVDLSTSEISVQDVPSGAPARPVALDGCVYGLWAESGYYVRSCGDPDLDQAAQFPELAAAKAPVFRTNRKLIVINDMVAGTTYLPLESMQRVDNWELISAQLDEQEQESEESDQTELSQVQEFSEEQHAPEAVDDELGARAGGATTLPILLNDIDIDGDVLTAVLKDVPDDITVSLAKDGRAARIEVPADRTGTVSFTYQASDGIDLSNVATVSVRIRSATGNDPPERQRPSVLHISERSNGEYSVLPDWVDPDGDPIFLENAVAEEGLAVTWRPDGFVSVRDLGTGGAGRRIVTVTVSDGEGSAIGELVVQVSPGASNVAPVANNDHYVATVGESITLKPLGNDTDADADDLKLVEVGPTAPEVEIKPDYQQNSIQFTASTAGSQTLVYTISDGPHTAKGKIRVDVIDPETASQQPAAENDLALLPPGGSVVVEPLLNDYDPAGGVLVIQGVSMGSSEGLTVEVVRHALLRVTAPSGLTEPQTFEYTVSNGHASTSAKVLVVPLAVQSQIQPPVAIPETTVVRTGDIVSVNALANDYSPSDLAISLLPALDVRSDAEIGEFFVSDEQVRFRAGNTAGTAEAIYTVSDSEGNVGSATVTITVRDFDERNQQPVPKTVEARTFSGSTVRVAIPMDGIDPDGDSVELVGVGDRAPQYGSVTVEGNYLAYEAARDATGTDTFTYRVQDRFGAEGDGTVRIGVVPRPDSNQAPVAVPDEIAARPNTKLEIPATFNDVDPDGDTISIVAGSVEPVDDRWDPVTEIQGQKVVVQTPDALGVYQLYYSITDGGGAPVVGVITVTVDANVPPVAPIARDDYVPANATSGLDVVEVPLLDNDEDPDGVVADLEVTIEAPAEVSGGVASVPLTDDRQIILYTVTDSDGLSAKAAVVVPGKDQIPPQLDPAKVPATVKGGDTLTIDFDEYVITRDGHSATLTGVETVVAGPGGNTEDPDLGLKVVDDHTVEFTPDTLFIGTTSVSFQVTDGETLDDPRGLTATLSLPITVESSGLFPPELRPSEIKVAPGEAPVEVSLAAMVDDPDPGDNEKMAYAVTSASSDVEATVSGQTINVAVPADTPVGSSGTITVSVHDGSTDPQEMTLPVTVITSTRPLMTVSDITEREGRVGQASTFDLSEVITNPFADRDGDIVLVGQPEVTGPADVSTDGLRVVVTPTDSGGASDAAEDVVVTYRVADATRDPARERTGVIRVTVKDTPKAPVNVTADAVGSRTARVTWTHSGWRGGTPKGFTVSWGGGSQFCGLQTSCDITTLANNNTYQFTVSAEVTEGDIQPSPESTPSNEIFVDVLPNTPSAPTATFGDRQIDLTWPVTTVPDGGSPVTSYTVDITPADASGRTQQEVTGTSLSWTNLTNGTAYTFTVTAHNKLTELDPRVDAPTGPASAPEIPAGAPSNQGAPQVDKDAAAVGVTPRANVSWSPPANPNGDTSFTYEMRQTGTTTVLYSGSGTSTYIDMAIGTEDKTFEVRSTNKSSLWSAWSPASNAVRAFQPPGAPTSFTLTPTGDGTRARFDFGAAAGNGAKPSEIAYRWNAGGYSGHVTSGQVVNSPGFPLGVTTSVRLTAISTVNGETAEGGSATANVNTYAPPAQPSVSASRASDGNVNLTWNMSSSSNGRPITKVVVDTTLNTRDGDQGLSGSTREGTTHDQNICITAYSVNSEGQRSSSVQRCATTRGKGTATATHGPSVGACSNDPSQQCDRLMLNLYSWYPGSRVTCSLDGTWTASGTMTVTVDGNGNWSGQFLNWVIAQGFEEGVQDATGDCQY